MPKFDRRLDFAARWPAPPRWDEAVLQASDIRVQARTGLHQLLISGNLDAARQELCSQHSFTGLWQVAEGDAALVRIARDRALLISDRPVQAADGWQEEGWCATDLSDASQILELQGQAIAELAVRGTSANLDSGSPSASILFAGVQALLYRIAEDCARLHVDRTLAPFLWRWLGVELGQMAQDQPRRASE